MRNIDKAIWTIENHFREDVTNNLQLMEAIQMKASATEQLQAPRFEKAGELCLVGAACHYAFDNVADIPNQWQSFAPLISRITPATKAVTYGVIYNGTDDSFDYLTAVELPAGAQAPEKLMQLELSAQTYAVFQHPGHVASVRETCNAIWSDWLPQSKKAAVEAPWFERYGKNFDPQTGAGGLEIWIPIAS